MTPFRSSSYMLVDEHYMTTTSVKENQQRNDPKWSSSSALSPITAWISMDTGFAHTIICNPSSHQHQVATDHITWRMLNDAYKTLRPGSKLVVVGNWHLGYHVRLKNILRKSPYRV